MTYLQAVNKVLKRLRENTDKSVDETLYSRLVGEFVNDANRMVEDCWEWSALRTTVTQTVTAADGIISARSQFTLPNVTSQFKTLNVINETQKCFMNLGTQTELQKVKYIDPVTPSVPTHYVYGGAFSQGVLVDVYPVPDKTYTLQFNIVDRTEELTNDTQNILAPSLPVVQFAHAMAVEERGETGGTTAAMLTGVAKSSLSDAISFDAARFPTETIWVDV
jgi:hypothetical protein